MSLLCLSLLSVTNYNNVVEAGSDSDDEDKLHIVEEEGSLADGADCDSQTLPDDEHPREHCWERGESTAPTHTRTHTSSPSSSMHHFSTLWKSSALVLI